MKARVTTALAAALALAAAAPVRALDPARAITQYVHDAWQPEHGLPQTTVLSLAQTPDGYLWLATEGGVARFDGVRFFVYGTANTPGLEPPTVMTLAVAPDGTLWAGTMRAGVFRRTARGLEQVATAADVGSNLVLAVLPEDGGSALVGTSIGEVYRVRPGRAERLLSAADTGATRVRALQRDRDGSAIAATGGGGLLRIRDGRIAERWSKDQGMPADLITTLVDRNGRIWVGANGRGLCGVEGGAARCLTSADGLPDDFVSALAEDRHGALWIGMKEGGLARYRDGRFEQYDERHGLVAGYVRSLLQDREGGLWAGTQPGGLHRFRDAWITPVGVPEGLCGDVVMSVMAARDGTLWAGTEGAGACRRVNGRWERVTLGRGRDDSIYAIAEAPDGAVWLGSTVSGLYRVQGDAVRNIGTADGLAGIFVTTAMADRKGRIWAGTGGNGISVLEEGRWRTISTADGLAHNFVSALYEGRGGEVWAGTMGGLSRIDPGGAVRSWRAGAGLVDANVSCILEDADGTLWLCTQRGLTRLRDGRFHTFGVREGLTEPALLGLLDDGQGHLWFSTGNGLWRVSRAELAEVADGRREAAAPVRLARAEGLRTTELNGGLQSAAARDSAGRLWFGSAKGLVAVDPARRADNPAPPLVHVEELLVDDRPVDTGSEVVLPPGTERFEVRYTATALSVPDRVRFEYRLDGFDGEWIDAGGRRTAYYTSLRPGDYAFEVRAFNEDGIVSPSPARVGFRLRPHFWQTVPFYVLCAAALALAGYGAARLRVRQLRARAAELERLVQLRTRELADEKERSERLLLNILPASIAQRLKHDQGSIAESFAEVTVLFADIVGFTEMSARMQPVELVALLNEVFSAFDRLTEKHGLEKIKTIGDAYMVVGGLPVPRPDHAAAVADMALEMREELERLNAAHGTSLAVRVGINTGPVVAGVIGQKKFIYDLWGDAVNTASRMESHGLPGQIQISASTRERLTDGYVVEERGIVRVKGKGDMPTWMLVGRAEAVPEAS